MMADDAGSNIRGMAVEPCEQGAAPGAACMDTMNGIPHFQFLAEWILSL